MTNEMIDETTEAKTQGKLKADQLARRMYVLLGRYAALDKMVSASASCAWEAIAQAPDRDYMKHRLLDKLYKDLAHKAAEHFPVNITKDPHGENYSTYGFVMSEEELITLLCCIYQCGLEEARGWHVN